MFFRIENLKSVGFKRLTSIISFDYRLLKLEKNQIENDVPNVNKYLIEKIEKMEH